MARPRKEGLEYFPHDTNAVNDKKLEALRMIHGNDGYAFYFILLEMIYQEPSFELDVSDAETIQILARKVEVTVEKFEQMILTAIKRECFDPEAYHERFILTSKGIKKRSNIVIEKREKMRERYSGKRSEKEPVSDAEIPPEMPQSKSKSKSKVKADKTLYAEQVFLSEDEYIKLIEKYGNEDNAKWAIEKLSNYKCSKATKYKSDYHVLIGWVFDEFEKKKLVVINGGASGGKYGGYDARNSAANRAAADKDADLYIGSPTA